MNSFYFSALFPFGLFVLVLAGLTIYARINGLPMSEVNARGLSSAQQKSLLYPRLFLLGTGLVYLGIRFSGVEQKLMWYSVLTVGFSVGMIGYVVGIIRLKRS